MINELQNIKYAHLSNIKYVLLYNFNFLKYLVFIV